MGNGFKLIIFFFIIFHHKMQEVGAKAEEIMKKLLDPTYFDNKGNRLKYKVIVVKVPFDSIA